MKKIILGCILAVCSGFTSVAVANDMCCPPVQSCCGGEFNGLYVGGNIGVSTHTAYRNDLDGFLTSNSGWSLNDTEFTAGVQLGYDWQFNAAVFGLVVDWNWLDHDNRAGPRADAGEYFKAGADWFTTIRGRFGLAVCDTLVYLTGGAAVVRFDNSWADTGAVPFDFNRTRWGWTGGVGLEYKFWCSFSVGAEILFAHVNNYRRSHVSGVTTFDFDHSDTIWVGRVLLNYRFGDLCGTFF